MAVPGDKADCTSLGFYTTPVCFNFTFLASCGHRRGDFVSRVSHNTQPRISRIHGAAERRGALLGRVFFIGGHTPATIGGRSVTAQEI